MVCGMLEMLNQLPADLAELVHKSHCRFIATCRGICLLDEILDTIRLSSSNPFVLHAPKEILGEAQKPPQLAICMFYLTSYSCKYFFQGHRAIHPIHHASVQLLNLCCIICFSAVMTPEFSQQTMDHSFLHLFRMSRVRW